MNIDVLVFSDITALDAVGPYEVLSRLPDAEIRWVGVEEGPVRTEIGLATFVAEVTIDDVDGTDILVVPGGFGTRALARDERTLDWIRRMHATSTWTTSVCTGAILLAAAGILDGVDATTHWAYFDHIASLGANPRAERVVERGKIMTAAGVSAGIDMALTLAARTAGDDVARAIQLGIEYDPQPPFDSGSVDKASPELVEFMREVLKAESSGSGAGE